MTISSSDGEDAEEDPEDEELAGSWPNHKDGEDTPEVDEDQPDNSSIRQKAALAAIARLRQSRKTDATVRFPTYFAWRESDTTTRMLGVPWVGSARRSPN